MIQVQLNHSNENPFYGLRKCLQLFQNSTNTISEAQLDACYNEVESDKVKRELFFSLLFSVGDITARQHNIFKGVKKDSGGNANREGFWTAFTWMKKNHFDQFIKFLNAGLFNEYTCFDFLFRSRVQTVKTRVVKVYDIFEDAKYRTELAKYIYSVVKGNNPFNKQLVAKFLTIPRLSKRQGHKRMLEETRRVMENKSKFLIELSQLMGWEYEVHGCYSNFKGYRTWRKEYNQDLESVLFSTGKILEFDKVNFLEWFDKLPAQARFRVKNRILYSKDGEAPKYAKFQKWYEEWETFKTKKQEEQRVLEEKVRQGQASETDLAKLEKVKKQAKVTVGATNFKDLFQEICDGNIDRLKLESFMGKVNLPYNSLVIVDDSGSMRGAPFNFATFIASVCLCKNPDDDARNLLGFFNTRTHWHSCIDVTTNRTTNSILRTTVAKKEVTPFVDPTKSFYENFVNIHNFCKAVFQGGGTNISAIPEGLKTVCNSYPEVLDALKSYPVWTIISDGEWNNLRSPEASLNDFFRKCENYFGFRPFIVAIDIADGRWWNPKPTDAERFSGIDNFMYIPSNPAQIEQFLTNFKDMDVFDVYTPLQSLYRSNRYELIREATL
jgi:hypothetical protein